VGLCGHFSWSDLVLDRSRTLVGLQLLAACAMRAGSDSDPYLENYDLFHAQSRTPDAVFTPVRGGRTGTSASGVTFSGEV